MASLVAQLRRKYMLRYLSAAITGSWGQKNMPNLWREKGRGGVKERGGRGRGDGGEAVRGEVGEMGVKERREKGRGGNMTGEGEGGGGR